MIKVSDSLAFFPKLKSTILDLVLLSSSTTSNNLKIMLKEFQLSVVCAIDSFMTTHDLTALHLLPEVAQHYKAYFDTKVKLHTQFGRVGWRYVKLLDPAIQMTAASQFPHLALAARAWVTAQPDCGSFSQVQSKKIPPTYVKKATLKVPAKFIKNNPQNLHGIRQAMLDAGMNIDLQELTDTKWTKIINEQ